MKPVRKRASYREAIEYIALNDAPADESDVEELTGYVSVGLVAAIFGKDQETVARDVFKKRIPHDRYRMIKEKG